MKESIEVVFFDLFHTLVTMKYNDLKNENDVLEISREEWEIYAEDYELYKKRATGKEKNPLKIIEDILKKMEVDIDKNDKMELLRLREERIKKSLVEVDPKILEVLLFLKKSGKKICIISNVDIIDILHWRESPLYDVFDDAVFSYEVGYLKPMPEIYEIALKKMKVISNKCIFVGDGGSNELEGAKELGINTILTGYLIRRDESELCNIKKHADYYIEDFNEIKSICV